MFASKLESISRVLYVSHENRDLTIIDNIGQQLEGKRAVGFMQTEKVDSTGAIVNITYTNMKSVIGRTCFLVQGTAKL